MIRNRGGSKNNGKGVVLLEREVPERSRNGMIAGVRQAVGLVMQWQR